MPTVLVTLKKHPSLIKNVADTLPQSFVVDKGHILYDELERQGLALPHGCLAGSCGACRVEVLKGEENFAPMGAIEQNTVAHLASNYPGKKIRLSCRAKVMGDIEVTTL